MKKILLKASNIRKSYQTPHAFEVLKGIDLSVAEGESIAIMGKSGEGKSTLLHILGTLEKATEGTLEICGKKVEEHSLSALRNEHIGFIFQFYNLLDDYTTLENILMPANIARKNTRPGSAIHNQALQLLEEVGLKERADFPAKFLSGGEKQRVAIARALCNGPDLILADEPSGNLDSAQSIAIHELLLRSSKQHQKTLIIVTHDRELASLCDHIFLLKEGQLCTFSS